MATRALPVPVAAPLAAPPRFGLLVEAVTLTDALRWEAGYVFEPEACSGAGVFDPCDNDVREAPDRPGLIEDVPFGVWAADQCSALGMNEADYRARARRALEAQQSEQVAAEFWTGAQSIASAWGNQHLANQAAADVMGETLEPVAALACLEQGLANYQGNRRGMIHCTVQTRTEWAAKYVIRREGNLWLTPQDHIVIADAGYDGSGPDHQPAESGNVWAYATGLVTVRLSDVEALPGTLAEATNRLQNTVTFWAQRLASPSWDGCALVAASLDLDVCQTGGS